MRHVLLLTAALSLAACSAPANAPGGEDEPQPAGFDVALVQSNFTAECADPIVVDDLFCEQVDLNGMRVEDGTILIVPTFLSATGMESRVEVICDVFARVHFDGETGDDFGFRTVGILDRDGGNAVACSVEQ